jgi:GntR family transcriptional regulator/MocR family aminotransferase
MRRAPVATPPALVALGLDPASAVPRYRQLYEAIRDAILAARVRPGARLPSTRVLAAQIGSSRNTVLAAFEQLTAEGYLEGRVGAGTTVACTLPDGLLAARPQAPADGRGIRRSLSRRGALILESRLARPPAPGAPGPFRIGVPALDAFPFEVWARLMTRRWRRVSRQLLDYGDPAGYAPLRAAIATYLREARAVRCEPEQVLVVTGSQQGIDLSARVLLDAGDPVWVEDPGYLGARSALAAADLRVAPVPLDAEGLDVRAGATRVRRAKLVYVTPSHQYPLGVTMSLGRRLALLEWAGRAGAWILEDDYDSEYRYAGRPLAALQGLDAAGRVIYLGTFSKVLFPGLRLGYLVVPDDLVDAFVAARALTDRHSPSVTQAVLADFIAEGHFARHIRRTRALYAERQAALVEAAARELDGVLRVAPADSGMHLVGWLPPGADDRAASRAAAAAGIEAAPLSAFRLRSAGPSGLLLGYAGLEIGEIRRGVHRLAAALRGDEPGLNRAAASATSR